MSHYQHHFQHNTALLLIDIQNDFLPGGSLAVPFATEILPIVQEIVVTLPHFIPIILTQDWHPPSHKSFASAHPGKKVGDIIELKGTKQILWPAHCVQGTYGSEISINVLSLLKRLNKEYHIVLKGTDVCYDSYSGFFDNLHHVNTGLDALLKKLAITRIVVMGLATDYCVLYTVLDALALGYAVTVIKEGCSGVNLKPSDSEHAFRLMQSKGCTFST